MSNAALWRMLDRLVGSHECDLDLGFLRRFLATHDEDAFAALVRRHGPLVYGTCLRILGNRDETDDAFQAVFFVLARRAHTLTPERGIGPWLHGVALRVAKKLRGQLLQRRSREMAAARPERVEAAEPDPDFWPVVHEELARLPGPLRDVLFLCDLGGQSHARAAESLGVAKGTVTKRLAKAHEELAARLRRRGITLGVGVLATLIATPAVAAVPAALVLETSRQAVAFSLGLAGGSGTAKALAEGVMRSLKVGGFKAWLAVGLLGLVLAGGGLMFAGGSDKPAAKTGESPEPAKATMWKPNFTVEYSDSLPVSVAFSADGKTLLTGDTGGEVMALIFPGDDARYRWKTKVGGSHAAVAFSADRKQVYATTEHGACILDADTGKERDRIEARDSNPTAIGVFPLKGLLGPVIQHQIVLGTPRGYFVKSWADGKVADTVGTIQTSTVAKGAKPADAAAVPLAVDPKGRSAIMTGPRDTTGKNVLWAYVCGDYSRDSPGNRLMAGHAATVVCAAWARNGATAVTGDADGRVIVWDARTMKESGRFELGGRVLALAISDDGKRTAAYVRGKRGGEVYAWEGAKPTRPIHTQLGDLGVESYASLAFSPDGKRLAGCAIDRKWLRGGKVHVWDLAAEPKGQPAPKLAYSKAFPKGSVLNFVILHDNSILMASGKPGAVDFRSLRDGDIQARLILGKFNVGGMKLSSDRKWLALQQHAIPEMWGTGVPSRTFEVGVYDATMRLKGTVPSVSLFLDIASGGKVVAVVREKKIELWDVAASKVLKSAPFTTTRIDAVCFSPDGKLLALTDRNQLVLWKWEDNTHERIDLGRSVGSLAFSPDGKSLAEGPTPRDTIRIRDVETRKVVQALSNGTKRSMNVPRLAYTQGGRVLIACNNILFAKEIAVPHRIHLWDTAGGSVAHEIALSAGLPTDIDVSPNGRYLAATIDEGESGIRFSVWRLDGEKPEADPNPPRAATPPR